MMYRRAAVLCLVRFRGKTARVAWEPCGLKLACGHVIPYGGRSPYYRKSDVCEACPAEICKRVLEELRNRESVLHEHLMCNELCSCGLCFLALER